MPTIKFKANKMSDAHVSHISLVERGANRIPLKIVKEEKQGMSKFASLDLGNFGAVFARKAEKPAPAIVGIVAMKGEGFESIKKQVEAAGFAVADMTENADGSVVFKQGDIEGDSTLVRLNDHVALVCKGFSPYNMDINSDGVTFADVCAAQGFYPGINTIMEVLASSVRDTVYASASPADAKTQVGKLFGEAQAYVSAFLAGMPVKAFKMEGIVPEVVEGAGDGVTGDADITAAVEAEMAPEGMTDAEAVTKGFKPFVKGGGKAKLTPEEQAAADAEAAKTKAKKGDGEVAAEGTGEAAATDAAAETPPAALTQAEVSDIVSTHVAKAMEALSAKLGDQIGGIANTFATVQKSVEEFSGSMTELKTRMETAEKVAKSAQEAVTGTVVHGSESGDTVQTKKSETSQASRDIDTGFQPKGAFPTRRSR